MPRHHHRPKRTETKQTANGPAKGHYFIVGTHAVQAALENKNRQIFRLLGTSNGLAKLRIPAHITATTVEARQLEGILPTAGEAVHQGVALEVSPLPSTHIDDLLATGRPLLMLDQVTDPHNVGAILRSAAAFHVAGIIMQDKHAPQENATIAKTAAGGLELVPLVRVTNLSRTLEAAQEQGYWTVGLDGHTDTELQTLSLSAKTLLVMGAEGKGLRQLVASHCDQLAKLPIHSQMESLNVSVATGIALYALSSSIPK